MRYLLDTCVISEAATALTFGLTLVTRNTGHVREPGVRLLDPWETGFPK